MQPFSFGKSFISALLDKCHRPICTSLLALIATVWLFNPQAQAHENTPRLSDYFKETYTTRAGLPHNTVNDIMQTADGYMWFATWEGVARYNGREFVTFDRSPQTGLPDAGIRALDQSPEVGLAVTGARGGIAIVKDYQWQSFPNLPTLSNQVLIGSDGHIWFATEGEGVYRQAPDGSQAHFPTTPNAETPDTVYSLAEVPKYGVLAGASHGLYYFSDDGFEVLPGSEALPRGRVMAIQWDTRREGLHLGTEAGLFFLKDGNISTLFPELNGDPISQILIDPAGSLWLGTLDRGLTKVSSHGIERMTVENGLPNNRIVSLFQDRENSVWVGTNGGLLRLREAPFTSITKQDGLSDNFVRTILNRDNGDILVGTSHGLSRIRAGRAEVLARNTPLARQSVLSLAEAGGGDLWVGTYTGGLFRWSADGALKRMTVADGLPSNEVRAVLPSRDGSLWIGTSEGLVRLKDGELQVVHNQHGLPGDFVIAIHENRQGHLWVGTGDGTAVIKAPAAATITPEKINLRGLDNAVYTFGFFEPEPGLVEDDIMWLATDRGLVRYNYSTDSLDLVGRDTGLPFDKYFAVLLDDEDHFWMSSNRGIVRFSRADALAVINGELERLTPDTFGEADGMLSAQANGGSTPTVAKTADGSLWFATATGVATIHPRRLEQMSATVPPVVIESFSVDGREHGLFDQQSLPAATNRIAFQFAGLGFVMPQRVRYQTMLAGFDDNWVERGNLNTSEYTNLAPGQYTFRVRAFYPNNEGASAEANLAFSVTPALWHYELFWLAIGIAIILLGVLGYRVRVSQLSASEKRLRDLVAQKTQELERQAREDQLTGIANRRAFDEQLDREFDRANRYQQPLCLALLDIDFFKRVNDDHSHAVGDKALIRIAEVLTQCARSTDFIARWGGEEFVILLPETSLKDAIASCERIRQAIAAADYNDIVPDLHLTISIGLSDNQGVESRDKLISRADEALYMAKRDGRDCVRHL